MIPRREIAPRQKRSEGGYKDDAHLAYIRGLPCAACHQRPSEAAHVRYNDHGTGKAQAIGQKPPDQWTVPLCAHCHTQGQEAQHRVGERVFWGRLEIDPVALALALYTSPRSSGVRLVIEAHQLFSLTI